MSAEMSRSVADYTATELRSIDELDAAIGQLVRQANAECYRMLVLVRGFSIVKEADGTLRFVTADGRTIPRAGYRLDDFDDDDVGAQDEYTSAEGFRTTRVRPDFERDEVRETRAVYRAERMAIVIRCDDSRR